MQALTRSVELLGDFAGHKRLMAGIAESLNPNLRLAETGRVLASMLAESREEQKRDRQEFRDVIMRLSVIAEAH